MENIEAILRAIFALPQGFHVLVVDDGSPDGTGDIVKGLQKEFKGRLHLEERTRKNGLGRAYIHGFKWALKRKYSYIFEMDADFSHDPKDVPRLLEACTLGGADVAIGSRYCKGVNVVNWPMSRVMLSWFASKYVRIITGLPLHDSTAGFKCYRRKVLETINLNRIRFVGYAFQIEMKFKAWRHGFKVVEVPVIFTNREKGTSKMSMGIFREAVLGVFFMRFRSIVHPVKRVK